MSKVYTVHTYNMDNRHMVKDVILADNDEHFSRQFRNMYGFNHNHWNTDIITHRDDALIQSWLYMLDTQIRDLTDARNKVRTAIRLLNQENK